MKHPKLHDPIPAAHLLLPSLQYIMDRGRPLPMQVEFSAQLLLGLLERLCYQVEHSVIDAAIGISQIHRLSRSIHLILTSFPAAQSPLNTDSIPQKVEFMDTSPPDPTPPPEAVQSNPDPSPPTAVVK
ncbi:MAG: hypothetical protein ACREJQ_03415 [bacterium]